MKNLTQQLSQQRKLVYWVLLGVCLFLAGSYYVLRFNGQWMDGDTGRLTSYAQAVLEEGTLVPGRAYKNGYTYPVTVAWLAQLTGTSIPVLQTSVLPVMGVLMTAGVAVMFFRFLLGNGTSAILATLFLFLQGDFIFVILRGSHEKLTWQLIMVALFILVHSISKPQKLSSLLIQVGLFYIAIYGVISTSSFFASSLITAISVAFLLGVILNRWQSRQKQQKPLERFQRLALISASSMVLLYLFAFHIYYPAIRALYELPTIIDKIATFFLGFEAQANPYTYLGTGWAYAWIYPLLSAFTWVLLFGSLAEWLYQGWRLLKGARPTMVEKFPWLMYAGFAAQVGIAIVLDFAGVLSSNLQLRLLPGLVIFAVVLAVQAIRRLVGVVDRKYLRYVTAAGAALVMVFTYAALLKASNDPIVSNKWVFHNASDTLGLRWTDEHVQNEYIWSGSDERLSALQQALLYENFDSNNLFINDSNVIIMSEFTIRYYLFTEIDRLRHVRIGRPLPEVASENQVYDNGGAELYHFRPLTPYQK